MVDRVTPASDTDEALRDYLKEELDAEALASFDAAQDLWESGELQRMIESGDFSDLPESVRPE